MDREKLKIALILIVLVIIVAIPIAIAFNYIWSQLVTVTVSDYTLTISDPPDGTIFDSYTFTGTLTLDGSPVEGKTITLFVDETSTDLTDTTDADGVYSISMIPKDIGLEAGTYTFKTVAEV